MAKKLFKTSALLYPLPVVMVTCADSSGKPNIITLAWAGMLNADPPLLYISLRKVTYSYGLIKEKGQFAVNLVTDELVYAADKCGMKSGRDTDKFKEMGLHQEKSSVVEVPIIAESPVSLECTVKDHIHLGSHEVFIGQIVATHIDEKFIDENGSVKLDKAGLIGYNQREYWALGNKLGYFGYSVATRK